MTKKQKNKFQELSNDDSRAIKSYFEDKEIIEDKELEELKKSLSKMGKDSILLGNLFLTSYDYLRIHYNNFDDEDIKLRTKQLLSSYHYANYFRKLIEDYGDGNEIGSFYSGEKIKDMVVKHRENMMYLINIFFKLVGDEDG